MFKVLDLGAKESGRSLYKQETSLRSVPKTLRSRAGCSNCKKRRRKCDEGYPICGYCKAKGEECIRDMNIRSFKRSPSIEPTSTKCDIIKDNDTNDNDVIDVHDTTLRPDTTTNNSDFDELNALQIYKADRQDLFPEFFDFDFSLPQSPSSAFQLYLDASGLQMLEFFKMNVSQTLCISPESSNYFLKTFFKVGSTEECILNALAAWGGVFCEGLESDAVKYHLTRAKTLVTQNYIEAGNKTKEDQFVIFCYYLIMIGVYVSSGDTKVWYQIFGECVSFLKKYGGILKFIKDFEYSNDAKWLISNFQFHDIMSSMALANGTSCTMNTYNNIFGANKILDGPDYGVDPNQGCIQPIILILGDILNTSAELKKSRKELNAIINAVVHDPLLDQSRLEHYQNTDKEYTRLRTSVLSCQPNHGQLLNLPTTDILHHTHLFKLHQIVCEIYLLLYIRQTQPKSSEVQLLAISAISIIESLMETCVAGSLKMAILITGMTCCNTYDRNRMSQILKRYYQSYTVGNFERLWDVIDIAWLKNPTGDTCIDWVDICEELGWKLSVC